MEKKETNARVTFTVQGQTRLVLTGATAVLGVGETFVTAALPNGSFTARGKNLKVVGFLEESGELTVMGDFTDFAFAGRKTPLLKRLFR